MEHGRQRSIDDISQCLAGLWSAVLHRDEIDPNANFFDLGGSSLKMIRVHASLQSALNIKLPIVDLFAHPTVAGLAQHIAAPVLPPVAEVVLPHVLAAQSSGAPPLAGAKQFRSFRRQTSS